MLDDFRLRVFKTVAQECSFTKAAKKLGISQPAVSQNISELEKILETELFERLKGKVRLTGDGRVFNDYADRILFWYDTTNRFFSSRKELLSVESLSISVPKGPASALIQPLASFLSGINPLIEVSFIQAASAKAEDCDFALISSLDGGNGIISCRPSEKFKDNPLFPLICDFLSKGSF